MKNPVLNAVPFAAFLAFSGAAQAADAESMRSACQAHAAAALKISTGQIQVTYEGQRTDRTHAVNGSAQAGGTTRTFQCSFAPDGKKIARFILNKAPATPAPAAEAAATLANTEWRLIEIQSMDDAIGTKRPDDPAKYTLALHAGGTAHLRLNCNSANGKWSAQPGTESTSGRFSLGPLATTRMLCPPPSLDGQLSAQAQHIRSFLLKDGKLHLSLVADAGILVWEPIPKAAGAAMTADRELEAAILAASPTYTRAVVNEPGGTGRGRYAYQRFDLNGDGTDEVFVYLLGSVFCGSGGCQLMIFRSTPDGYYLVNSLPITRLPIIVSSNRTSGWSDLWKKESGGGAPASYLQHTFDGKRYVERKRIPAGEPPQGQQVLPSEITFETGIPLTPYK